MNQGVLQQSSPVQQMMAAAGGFPNLWSINTMRPPPTPQTPPYFSHPPPPQTPPNVLPSSLLFPTNPSWLDHHQNQDHHRQHPESWSQLLLGGQVGGAAELQVKASLNHFDHSKQLENNWEEEDQDLLHRVSSGSSVAAFVDVKKEIYGHHQDFQAITKPSWSPHHQVIMPVSTPNSSCVTTSFSTTTTTTTATTTTANKNMLGFSSKKSDRRDRPPDQSSLECNSTSARGGAAKKARVQPSSTQPPFKVRKEKVGDRITALHQLVSPFGKTDTASVLLEATGYIRFLQSQIEALSLPYLASVPGNNNNKNIRHHQQQNSLLNGNCMKRKLGAHDEQDCISEEGNEKDLRSRGLCLVPVSCTLEVGSENINAADYWGPAAALCGAGFQ